jgi:type VI secretion system protein ImpK
VNTPTLTIPSLIDTRASRLATDAAAPTDAHSLVDLLYDGFYGLFLLKNGCPPVDDAAFSSKMQGFLDDVERRAKKLGISTEDTHSAKYAFCAAVDEIILRSDFPIRDKWAQQPLQLVIFGDQLAGEHFFSKLEALQAQGSVHLQALEVFHMCLLLGFQGKYALEGPEKLHFMTARLGDDIARLKGRSAGFAPAWARPDTVANKLRSDVPLWVVGTVFALIALSAFIALDWALVRATRASIDGYGNIVRLAPAAANLTIRLP